MSDEKVTAERTTLAAVYADIQSRIADLEGSRAGVRARLLELGAGPAGPLRVQVTQSRRLNTARFQAKYDYRDHPEYYETKPIAAIAKALPDAADCYDGGTPSLSVVEAD